MVAEEGAPLRTSARVGAIVTGRNWEMIACSTFSRSGLTGLNLTRSLRHGEVHSPAAGSEARLAGAGPPQG